MTAIPTPSAEDGLRALKALLAERHPLAALQSFNRDLGEIFRVNLPGFKPVVMVGPDAARFVLVQGREGLRWRNETDPVTRLLGHGVLVTDGDEHDRLRRLMTPALHKKMLDGYVEAIHQRTRQVADTWQPGNVYDMLVEMRKVALLALLDTLYLVDFTPDLQPLWQSILGSIGYISPGIWMLWPGVPRPQYRQALAQMDEYLFRIIRARRAGLAPESAPTDLLGLLIQAGLDDSLVRDQLLTMLIAGHDTSTALLAWTLYLLGAHPEAMQRARNEVDTVSGGEKIEPTHLPRLEYLENVMREALRLYPPIHLGSRVAAADLDYKGMTIPAGERVIYSIYLTQRHPDYWENPDVFDPDRHQDGTRDQSYTWLAFGGGPRNCIGAAYGQVEVKVILAHLLQIFNLTLLEKHVHPHMGATLEPRPGVRMRVSLR